MKHRLEAMLALLEHGDPTEALTSLCETGVHELDITGAAVSVIVGDVAVGVLASAGVGVAELEAALVGLDGPRREASSSGRPVAVPDIAASPRWEGVIGEAADRFGIAALFAFPLRVGGAQFGGLVLGRDRPGVLAPHDTGDAIVLADVAGLLVLAVQARSAAGETADALDRLVAQRAVVHQAAGMISAQLGVDIAEAQVLLRARSWAFGRSSIEVARDVVDGLLRLDKDG